MSYSRKRFVLSTQDSHALEPRHLLTAAHVGSFTEVPPLQNHVGLSIGHVVAPHDQASAASKVDATNVTTHSVAPRSSLSGFTHQLTSGATPTSVSPSVAAATKTFTSLDAAAKDWGNSYNQLSITNNKEYGSTFYKNADGTYSYSDPAVGTNASVTPAPPPAGQTAVGVIHSHAAYDPVYGPNNEHFSSTDIAAAKADNIPYYLATPCGDLLLYDLGTGDEVLVSNALPRDPNDPNSP